MIANVVGCWKAEVSNGFHHGGKSCVRLDSVETTPQIGGASRALWVRIHGLVPDSAPQTAAALKRFLKNAKERVELAFPGSSVSFEGHILPWHAVMDLYAEIDNPQKFPFVSIFARVSHSDVEQVTRKHLLEAVRHLDGFDL